MATTARTLPPITTKELIALQEFVTIPTYLIRELPPDKLYALLDILSMADENGEIHTSERKLMDRWGWGNNKVRKFLDDMRKRSVLEAIMKRSRSTVLVVNSRFLAVGRSDNEAIMKRSRSDKTINKTDDLRMILDIWNELSEHDIEPIPEMGISSVQYQKLKSMVEKYGIEDVASTIQRIKFSDFLQGKVTEWKITFNWFLKDGNYQKVRSGKYDRGNSISRQAERGGSSEQAEDEELIGDEWVDL